MAVKTTDFIVNIEDFNTDGYEISASKKSAIRIDGLTKDEVANLKFKIQDGNLVITDSSDKKLVVKNYTGIKYIKTDYVKNGKKVTYNLTNIIDTSMVDNTLIPITADKILVNKKSKSASLKGTVYNDSINASTYDQAYKLTINANSGNDSILGSSARDIINAGNGNDTIVGTIGNDTITGGKGVNTIKYLNTEFGVDTVKLTKGETLNINFADSNPDHMLYEVSALNKNDIAISNGDGFNNGTVVIKNYATKNTGATVLVNGHDLTTENLLKEINAYNYFSPSKTKYTGTMLADSIDASDLDGLKKTVKKVTLDKEITDSGVSISAGNGNDIVTGSKYSDTIKGGNGDDTITGGTGNDKLYGDAGLNLFKFNKGDGKDIVYSGKGNDKLNFVDSDFSDLVFERGTGKSNRNLIIKYNIQKVGDVETFDSVTVQNYYKVDKKGKITGITSSVKEIITKSGTCSLADAIEASETYAGRDFVIGSGTITSGDKTQLVLGSDSNDTIAELGKNVTEVYARAGDDSITGSYDSDSKGVLVYAGDGNDTIYMYGQKGKSTLYGGNGSDNITGSYYADDLIFGDNGLDEDPDQTQGDSDLLKGGLGSDIIYGGGGNDEIHGYHNNGDKAYDTISCTKDVLHGGAGNDSIFAESEENELYGDSGDDTFYLQYGSSTVCGGDGNNTYVARYVLDAGNNEESSVSVHTIDFSRRTEGNDTIYFEKNTSFDELSFHKNNDDLRILYTAKKEIVLKDFYKGQSRVTNIKVKDGEPTPITDVMQNRPLVWDSMPVGGNLTEGKDSIDVTGDIGTINAGAGNDTINLQNIASTTVNAGAGDDSINATSSSYSNYLDGGAGNDTIVGASATGGGAGTIVGGAGADSIIGNFGADLIFGGEVLTEEQRLNPEQYLTDTSANYIEGAAGNDTIFGGAGNDTIYTGLINGATPTYYEDVVYAGAGDDEIHAQSKTNIIYAGQGNDTINGSAETEEIIIYKKGDGTDTVDTGVGTNDSITINGYTLSELNVSQDGDDIVIAGEENDKIILKNAVTTDVNPSIIIDGVTYSILDSRLYTNVVTSQNTFVGTKFADSITGTDEADTLNGGTGNDTLNGGIGNDSLIGGTGLNTYEFKVGDGVDTVVSVAGGTDIIKFTDVTVSDIDTIEKVGDNLEISYGISDKIVLENYFVNLPSISLEDSTGITTLQEKLTGLGILFAESGDSTANGTDADNTIIGSAGNNTIIGNHGNDTMNGGLGDDTYVFNSGDGNDTVIDTNATNVDKLKFNDVEFSSLKFEEVSNDLVIKYNPHIVDAVEVFDSVTVKNYFTSENTIKTIVDSTDEEFDIAVQNKNIVTMADTTFDGTRLNDSVTGTSGNDTINGNAGNDTINAGAGNDIINTGAGNDIITTGVGNDTIKVQTGDGTNTVLLTDEGESDVNIIEFTDAEGIGAISHTKEGNDLVIANMSKETVILKDYFTSDRASTFNTVKIGEDTYNITDKFTNFVEPISSTGLDIVGLENYRNYMKGTSYTDTITGGNLNDNIMTMAGDDTVYARAGNDTITCPDGYSSGRKYIDAGNGNDSIQGGAQENETDTGSIYIGGLGSDTISANKGNDTIYGDLELNSTNDIETVNSTGDNDTIHLISGNNVVYAGGGNDTVYTGAGNDTIYLGEGSDTVVISRGDGKSEIYLDNDEIDTIKFEHLSNLKINTSPNYIRFDANNLSEYMEIGQQTTDSNLYIRSKNTAGGLNQYQYLNNYNGDTGIIFEGNDNSKIRLYRFISQSDFTSTNDSDYVILSAKYGQHFDSIRTLDGDDFLVLSNADNSDLTVDLGDGSDTLSGSYCDINTLTVYGGDGNDSIYAFSIKGQSTLYGGAGMDTIDASNYYGTLIYGDYDLTTDANQELGDNDNIIGYSQNDTIYGGGGNDYIDSDYGDDSVYGGYGDDTISGNIGSDTIYGGAGDDTICSNINNGFYYTTLLNTESDEDYLYGESGNDKLYCQSGITHADGGADNDAYFINTLTRTSYITDESGNDEMVINFEEDAGTNIVFNVSQDRTVAADSMWILNNDNYIQWQNGNTTTGINIKGDYDSIERITVSTTESGYYGDGSEHRVEVYNSYLVQYVTTAQINKIAQDVSSWLATYNDGAFASVNDILTSGTSTDIANLVQTFDAANTTAWQTDKVTL